MQSLTRKLSLTFATLAMMGCSGGHSTSDYGQNSFLTKGDPAKVQCFAPRDDESHLSAAVSNEVRSKVGLHPVTADPRLAKAAAKLACKLAKNGESPHSSFQQGRAANKARRAGYNPIYISKNVWAGADELRPILEDMNRTPVHLKSILAPQVRHIGAGSAVMSDGRTVIRTFLYAVDE